MIYVKKEKHVHQQYNDQQLIENLTNTVVTGSGRLQNSYSRSYSSTAYGYFKC